MYRFIDDVLLLLCLSMLCVKIQVRIVLGHTVMWSPKCESTLFVKLLLLLFLFIFSMSESMRVRI